MSQKLINMIEVAKATENFYLSNLNTSYILVKFNYPIDETLPFKVIRKISYQETLNYVLANIIIYISVCTKIKTKSNGIEKEFVGIGVQHRNLIIEGITTKQFVNNNIGYSYIGEGPSQL